MDMAGPRVASLEKDILFLQQTHKATLEKLHEETEHLRRANKGMKNHFKHCSSMLFSMWAL